MALRCVAIRHENACCIALCCAVLRRAMPCLAVLRCAALCSTVPVPCCIALRSIARWCCLLRCIIVSRNGVV
eukprot:997698-Lingulodinium_polyedra.AAC.1